MKDLKFSGPKLDALIKKRWEGNYATVADLVGVNYYTIRRYVSGETTPDADTLIKLARFLGVKQSQLVKSFYDKVN